MGCRCFWDADTDNYADESYRNVRSCRSRAARSSLPHASACPGAAGAPLTDALFAPAGLALLRRGRLRGVPVLRGTVTHDIASLARASPLARPSLSPARGDSVVFPTSRHCVPYPRACCSFTIKLLSGAKSDTHTNTLSTFDFNRIMHVDDSPGPPVVPIRSSGRVRRRCQSGKAAGSRMRCGVANDYVMRGI